MDTRLLNKGYIIFDIGNVLLTFDPDKAVDAFAPEGMQQNYMEYLINAPAWQELDRGTLTYEEAAEAVCKNKAMAGEEENVLRFLNSFTEVQEELPAAKAIGRLKDLGKNFIFCQTITIRLLSAYMLNIRFSLFDGFRILLPSPR